MSTSSCGKDDACKAHLKRFPLEDHIRRREEEISAFNVGARKIATEFSATHD